MRQVGMAEVTWTLDASGDEAEGDAASYDGLIARGHDDLLVSTALMVVLDGQQ